MRRERDHPGDEGLFYEHPSQYPQEVRQFRYPCSGEAEMRGGGRAVCIVREDNGRDG